MNTPDNTHDSRPLGAWLRTVDRLLTAEFATAFTGEGVDRRDWMLLRGLARENRPVAPGHGAKRLRRLAERGWITEIDGFWTLTDEGRASQRRLADIVDGIRSRVAGAVSPEDFATTLASLEAIARELGWTEDSGERVGRFGRFGRGHGGHRGHGDERGCRGHHPHGDHRGHHGHHHGHRGHHRRGERAYERGFDAGFERGRAASAA